MRKLILLSISLCSITLFLNAIQENTPLNQQEAKKTMIFSNGKSYQDLDQELSIKHPNKPESLIISGYGSGAEIFENKIINLVYSPNYFGINYRELNPDTGSLESKQKSGDCFLIPEKLTKLDYDAARFLLTHEIGHSQQPNTTLAIQGSTRAAFLPIAYYWKKIVGSRPYKNRFTKYGSKFFAAEVLTTLVANGFINLEERRADNFAIKHCDAKALQAAIKEFQANKEILQKEWSSMSSYIPFRGIGNYVLDPIHPSFDSRIAKIKGALKTRFGIETEC